LIEGLPILPTPIEVLGVDSTDFLDLFNRKEGSVQNGYLAGIVEVWITSIF